MSCSYLIEHFIFRYALRKKYVRFLQDFEFSFMHCILEDIDIFCLTLQRMVHSMDFLQFEILIDLLHDFQMYYVDDGQSDEINRLIFLIKFLNILGCIGHKSTDELVILVQRYFDLQSINNEKQGSKVHECRKFILSILVREDRQKHFMNKKFPAKFTTLIQELQKSVDALIHSIQLNLELCEIEKYLHGERMETYGDPSIMLFCEHFPQNSQEISESCLTVFMNTMFSSQISITPPQLFSQIVQFPTKDSPKLRLSLEKCQQRGNKNSSCELFSSASTGVLQSSKDSVELCTSFSQP